MKTLDTLKNLNGKKVIVRVDFNVPFSGKVVNDDNRVVSALPTIKELLRQGAALILMSHLGKIKWGKVDDAEIEKQKAKNNMEIVVPVLAKHLPGVNVKFCPATHGEVLKQMVSELQPGEVLLMQNTRYEKGEEKNDPALSAEWASLGDAFVMDAFGSAHRAHASTYGIPSILQEKAVGYLVEKEVKSLATCVNPDKHPYIAILGGFKVSDKIKVIDTLLQKCDKILIGGAMSYTFKKGLGQNIGTSPFEEDQIEYAMKCYASGKIMIPVDSVCADSFDNPVDIRTVNAVPGIPEGFEGLDIGPKTAELYAAEIAKAKIIFWNGPMGVFENPLFTKGTVAVCEAIANNKECFSVIGGGDSASAAKQFGYVEKFSHVSTGGGASLEMIELEGHLPGIDIIG